ncbi:MAG: DUF2461 domain-containing protein [Candidatus Neomarinimicrobiota bacterium]
MPSTEQDRFIGFSPKTLAFLKGLEGNNNKIWFEAHKQDYLAYLLEPLQRLVADLSEFMLTIDPLFETRPAIDKTISRIYRDTRFSKDKSPFRARMWLTFKRPRRDWKAAPAYFFEISPDSYRYGMGFYSAPRAAMEKIREMMDNDADEFQKAVSIYKHQSVFTMEGDKYKRRLDPAKPEEIQEWYQRRNIYFVCNRNIDEVLFSKRLNDDLISGFRILAPIYNFLWKVVAAS